MVYYTTVLTELVQLQQKGDGVLIQLDYKSGVPIYDQLINNIIRLKMLGALKAGDALPSVRALAAKLSINPNTVQRAYQMLEEKGIIYSAPGKGSFIAEDNESEQNIKKIAVAELKKAMELAISRGLTSDDITKLTDELFNEGNK